MSINQRDGASRPAPASTRKRSVAPFLRAAQSHFPFLRPLKFATYNLAMRYPGLRMDAEFRLLSRMKADLAVDVGGNSGQSILAFKRVAAPKRIVCFEPSAVLARRLKRIFRGDRTVRVELRPFRSRRRLRAVHAEISQLPL